MQTDLPERLKQASHSLLEGTPIKLLDETPAQWFISFEDSDPLRNVRKVVVLPSGKFRGIKTCICFGRTYRTP